MVEYKSKVKLAANASASLDILVRAAGRGHRIRQLAKRYACEVVHVCLLGFLRVRVCLPVLFLHACAQVCPSVPKWAHGPKCAQKCPRVHALRVTHVLCLSELLLRPVCIAFACAAGVCLHEGPSVPKCAHVCPRVHQ